ncbi:MAG TPA: hypothetical protein VNV88_12050 [Candidatus Solibacter sp.]|jgi:hypothetical protein|nr:hypothetical protein [Candidatus Solibacter sp.]
MSQEKKDQLPDVPVNGAAGQAKNSERVRSSRYEWEKRPEELRKEVAKGAGQSWMASLRSWLRRFLDANNRFFDNDDDRTASAA